MDITTAGPLAGVLDNSELPACLHALADKWRDLDDRLLDAEVALGAAQAAVERAKHGDHFVMVKAVNAGADLPPGGEQEAAAREEVAIVTRQRDAVAAALADTGRELHAALLAHRDEIAGLARPRIEAAISGYKTAIDQARKALAKSGGVLSDSTAAAAFLKSLDENPRGIDVATLTVPPPALADAAASVARAEQWLERLGQPTEVSLFNLIAPNGVAMCCYARQAWPMLGSGRAELADPSEMPRLRAAMGHSPE